MRLVNKKLKHLDIIYWVTVSCTVSNRKYMKFESLNNNTSFILDQHLYNQKYIIQMEIVSEKIEKQLRQFKEKIISTQKIRRFAEIFRFYKQISKKISYLVQLNSEQKENKRLHLVLQQYFMILQAIINSTSYQSCGHALPLFKYLTKFLQKNKNVKKYLTSFDDWQKMELSQEDCYFKDIKLSTIEKREQEYLSNLSFNREIVSIIYNQIKLPNSQCVCCSQVFLQNFKIQNQNPKFKILIGLNESESQQASFERYLCAVCNAGGGVIIVGAQKKQNSIFATGINYGNKNQIQKKQNEIIKGINSIRPYFFCEVKRVNVHTNFILKDNILGQKHRCCFRISITPFFKRKYYLQISNKGFHNLYETYELSKDLKPIKIEAKSNKEQSITSLYKLIHQDYYSTERQNKYTFHKKINCIEPYPQYSKLFEAFIQENKIDQMKGKPKQGGEGFTTEDEPKFKYANTSLLAVSCKSNDRYIEQLGTTMKLKKMLFNIQKPFQNDFKDGKRSIQMLSHNDKHQTIKICIKENNYSGFINLIPVHKSLQIQKDKLSYELLSEMKKKFLKRYQQGFEYYQTVDKDQYGSVKNLIILYFSCFSHAIFAYLIFESYSLKPFFVRDNTTYKKKAH